MRPAVVADGAVAVRLEVDGRDVARIDSVPGELVADEAARLREIVGDVLYPLDSEDLDEEEGDRGR